MDHELQLPARELGRILSAPDGSLNLMELAIKAALEEKFPDPAELEAVRERALLSDSVESDSNGQPCSRNSGDAEEELPAVSIGVNVRRPRRL